MHHTMHVLDASFKRPCLSLIQNEVQNEKTKNWRLRLLTSKGKRLSSFGFRPYTINEKKTNDDDELVVGPLENKSQL